MAKSFTIITINQKEKEFNYIYNNLSFDNFKYEKFQKETGLIDSNYKNKIIMTKKTKGSTGNRFLFKTDDKGYIKLLNEQEINNLVKIAKEKGSEIIYLDKN